MPKKRISKKERRRLAELAKREEEERIRKEEEEKQRLIREAEEAERRRLAAIAEAKRKAEEKKRLEIEEEEIKEWRATVAKNYSDQLKMKEMKNTWEKHMQCNEMPDASNEADLTAYYTEYSKPFNLDVKTMDAEPFLEHCEYTEKILENV